MNTPIILKTTPILKTPKKKPQIILASTSFIRQQLCQQAGIPITCEKANIDERDLEQKWNSVAMPASMVAERLALAKAKEVSLRFPKALVIGADQTLEVNKLRLNKAETIEEVRAHLLLMRGRTHDIHASVAVTRGGKNLFVCTKTAKMTMHKFTNAFLESYLESEGEKVKSSVGCYQFEGRGISLFSTIKGDYHTILGLPLLPLTHFLRGQDWIEQ